VIRRQGASLQLEDLNSSNGTFLNGAKIRAVEPIRLGDRLAFGSIVLRLVSTDAATQFGSEGELDTARVAWDEIQSLRSPGGETSLWMRGFLNLGEFLIGEQTPQEVYDACLDALEQIVPFEYACLFVLDEAGRPVPRASRRRGDASQRELAVSHSMVEAVIRERTSLLVRDAQNHGDFPATESVVLERIRSAMVVPLFDNTRVIGVLYVDTREERTRYTRKHLHRLALLSNILAVKISNTRLREAQREKAEELQIAARIQRRFLCSQPPCPAGYELHVRLAACTEVAGDLYDVLVLPSGRYLFVLGDVVGHGVGAALLMANALATVRALARHIDRPRDFAQAIHDELGQADSTPSFITLFLGLLDPAAHRMVYVNAGHEPPALFVPGGTLSRLSATGPPVGLPVGLPFEEAAVEVPPGSLFGAWSDGLPEAHQSGVEPVRFLADTQPVDAILAELLASHRRATLPELADLLFERVDDFLEGAHAPDDQTLMLLRRVAA
jgi:sigma-B regulation protein RsbU (phosphoserine phosphatase)